MDFKIQTRRYLFDSSFSIIIILIQRKYRKYKLNKKIKIYKQLPLEIKSHIIYLTNEDERCIQLEKSIERILVYKFYMFLKEYLNTFDKFKYLNRSIINYNKQKEKYHKFNLIGPIIIHYFYLMNKYSNILIKSENFYSHHYIFDNFFPGCICDNMLLIGRIILSKNGIDSFQDFKNNNYLQSNIENSFKLFKIINIS
jgi:hypothetical protein